LIHTIFPDRLFELGDADIGKKSDVVAQDGAEVKIRKMFRVFQEDPAAAQPHAHLVFCTYPGEVAVDRTRFFGTPGHAGYPKGGFQHLSGQLEGKLRSGGWMRREQGFVIESFIQLMLIDLRIKGQIDVVFFTVVQISIFCIIVLTKIMDGWYYSNPGWSNLLGNREICSISEIWHIISEVKSLIRGSRNMVVVSVMFIMLC